jgi:hypothetical protein
MPRLNYGTLLENIVVTESTRICLDQSSVDEPVAFASAFAMPPLTQCWCKPSEVANSPCFNDAFLRQLAAKHSAPQTLEQFWSLCINNTPNVLIHPFHGDQVLRYPAGGPNGALLACMLAAQRHRPIHLWINDNAERYDNVPPTPPDKQPGSSETLSVAALLVGTRGSGTTSDVTGWFPHTIPHLAEWLVKGTGRGTAGRIGFLGPDNYAEGQTQVSSGDHQHWLRVLATDCAHVLSATFSGCQNRGSRNAARNQRLASFNADEAALYPRSLVFEYRNFQTGVKIRWPDDSIDHVVVDLRQRVEAAWCRWSFSMNSLTVHLDGQAAN